MSEVGHRRTRQPRLGASAAWQATPPLGSHRIDLCPDAVLELPCTLARIGQAAMGSGSGRVESAPAMVNAVPFRGLYGDWVVPTRRNPRIANSRAATYRRSGDVRARGGNIDDAGGSNSAGCVFEIETCSRGNAQVGLPLDCGGRKQPEDWNMRVNAISLIAALAVLILSGVMTGQAEAGCNDRIGSDNATCLSSRIAHNSWGDMYAKAKNLCHETGCLVARVVVSGQSDHTWTLCNGDERSRKYLAGADYRATVCCWDDSSTDLCFKQEIEPNSYRWIKFKSGNERGSANVYTAKRKCAFCERYPDTIWCENSFDDSICESGEDGDIGGISSSNCQTAWNASPAAGSCTITARSNNSSGCIYQANCQGSSGTEASGTISVADAYHLHNCGGDLRVGECPR